MTAPFSGVPAGESRGGNPSSCGQPLPISDWRISFPAERKIICLTPRLNQPLDEPRCPILRPGSFKIRPPPSSSGDDCRDDDGADRGNRYPAFVAAGVLDWLDDGRGRIDVRARLHSSDAASTTSAGRTAARSRSTTGAVGARRFWHRGARRLPEGGYPPRGAGRPPTRRAGLTRAYRRAQSILRLSSEAMRPTLPAPRDHRLPPL